MKKNHAIASADPRVTKDTTRELRGSELAQVVGGTKNPPFVVVPGGTLADHRAG